MRIKFTRKPTMTKALIATAIFAIAYLATTSSLPSCNSADGLSAALNGGECIERQSLLHTWCGWLAIISLLTGVALFLIKQYRASTASSQATSAQAPSQAWPGASAPTRAPWPPGTGEPGPQAYGYRAGQAAPAPAPVPEPSGSPARGQAATGFCTQCGRPAVWGDSSCQQCGTPYAAAQ